MGKWNLPLGQSKGIGQVVLGGVREGRVRVWLEEWGRFLKEKVKENEEIKKHGDSGLFG